MTDVLRADAHEWARDEAIRMFLKSRPEFVRDDPELMEALGLRPDAGDPVGSVALIRLSLWSPARSGILGFGAEDEGAFAPDMGHELIDFLARVVERIAERWPLS